MRAFIIVSILAAALGLMAACQGQTPVETVDDAIATPILMPTPTPAPAPTATPESARPTSVTVSTATVELTALGTTTQLGAEVHDQDSTVMTGFTVTWTTSANSVATVDAAGVVTAAGNGTATITATAGSASGAAMVTVTQTVASVEVSPSVAELTAWGETVQLTAEALDANGHAVAGAAFSWESDDALVAEVDTIGLVSGIGEGVATITASAGAASGSAMVTVPPTFTLSGTVRDSRRNEPMLAGAVVRLENGKRESMVIGPDGRYRFPNVWGTVTVKVIAVPTHVTETVEITVDEDRTLDFDLEHTGVPPYGGTVFISPRVIEPSDPTTSGASRTRVAASAVSTIGGPKRGLRSMPICSMYGTPDKWWNSASIPNSEARRPHRRKSRRTLLPWDRCRRFCCPESSG